DLAELAGGRSWHEPPWIEWRLCSGHLEGRGDGRTLFTVARLVLDRREIVDRGMQPVRVEPADPLGGLPLDLGSAGPGLCPVDQLGLVETDRRFHQRVVEGVADAADGTSDARPDHSFG